MSNSLEQQRQSESAPISRSGSLATVKSRYCSVEQLQRLRLREATPLSLPGNATLGFDTKLDSVAGVLFLINPCVTVTADCAPHGWQLQLDFSSCAAGESWQHKGRIQFEFAAESAAGDRRWRTAASDAVVPVPIKLQQQQLLISGTAVAAGADSSTVCLGHVLFPTDQVNEPVMSFAVAMETEPKEWRSCSRPRLQVGLQYCPGQRVSEMRVQLARALALPQEAAAVVATLTATVGGEASGRVSLQSRACGAGESSFEQTVDLPIDNADTRASGLVVALATLDAEAPGATRPIGFLRFGDFALASGGPMHHWREALSHPHTWLRLTHCCRQ